MEFLESVDNLVIHHTERNNDSPFFVKMRHVHLRGWEDVGYHYLIGNVRPFSKNGKVYQGRPEELSGAHAKGRNRNSLGICLIGNFDKVVPSERQMETLLELVESKMAKYRLRADAVVGHNELPNATKSCPGRFVDLDYVRSVLSKGQSFHFGEYVERVLGNNSR